MKYMTKICGVRDWQINPNKTTARAEVVPMQFMAELTVNALRQNIVAQHVNQYKGEEMQQKLVDRCLRVYLFVLKKLKDIRYGDNPRQDLQEMVAALTSKAM